VEFEADPSSGVDAVAQTRMSGTEDAVTEEWLEARAEQLRSIIRARLARQRYFPAELFGDPAWDMLLDLTLARLEGKKVSVSSLCIAAGVPTTTALRRIAELESSGLVTRERDTRDGRRVYVNLTAPALAQMLDYLGHIDRRRTL
jgi:hypothetical protein